MGKPIWEIAVGFLYAQVKKIHRRRRLVKVEHLMLCGEQEKMTTPTARCHPHQTLFLSEKQEIAWYSFHESAIGIAISLQAYLFLCQDTKMLQQLGHHEHKKSRP
jgi:hypothetical protein